MNKLLLSAVTVAILASCGGGSSSGYNTAAYKGTVNKNTGVVSTSGMSKIGTHDEVCFPDLGCAGYAVGLNQGSNKYIGTSGYYSEPNAITNTAPSVATTYSTAYEYALINVYTGATGSTGYYNEYEGILDLDFDPSTDKLSGSNGNMKIDATVNGTKFSGSYDNNAIKYSGKVEGNINPISLLGSFHGKDSNTVMAGYLYGIDENLLNE